MIAQIGVVSGQIVQTVGIVDVVFTNHPLSYLKGFCAQTEGFVIVTGAGIVAGLIGKHLGIHSTLLALCLLGDGEGGLAPLDGFGQTTGIGKVFG